MNKLLSALTELDMKLYLEKLSTHFSFVVFFIQNYELIILWSDYKTVYDFITWSDKGSTSVELLLTAIKP